MRRLVKWLAPAAIVLLCAGCASQLDGLVHSGVPPDQLGKVYGSVAVPREEDQIEGLGITLQSTSTGTEASMMAGTRAFIYKRGPSQDSGPDRIWVFYGQLPAGEYRIVRVTLDFAPSNGGRGFPKADLVPDIPITITVGPLTYLGRWTAQELGRPKRERHRCHLLHRGRQYSNGGRRELLRRSRLHRPLPQRRCGHRRLHHYQADLIRCGFLLRRLRSDGRLPPG